MLPTDEFSVDWDRFVRSRIARNCRWPFRTPKARYTRPARLDLRPVLRNRLLLAMKKRKSATYTLRIRHHTRIYPGLALQYLERACTRIHIAKVI